MQIEDIIYDAAVLKMGVCLERFLKRDLNVTQLGALASMISKFSAKRNDKKTRKWMYKIRDARNKAAHSNEKCNKVDNSSDKKTDAVFNFESFQKIRRIGLDLDDRLRDTIGHDTGMSEIMISSSLPYDMGNAGDLLKHGALAIFVDWFLECGAERIRYADPFGGRPWGYIFNEETRRRMGELSSLPVIQHAQPDWRKNNKYYGSSHVVRNIAKARGRVADVFASDKDRLARSDLEASGIRLIDKQYKEYEPKYGFDILNERYSREFDLILLDPFADFLLNEFGYRREQSTGHFDSIFEAVKRNPKLCVMLFVLHVERHHIPDRYVEKRENIRDFSFSMRCPKISGTQIDGEAGYDMEILLTSMRFAEKSHSVGVLKDRLIRLAQTLEEVLLRKSGGNIVFWPTD